MRLLPLLLLTAILPATAYSATDYPRDITLNWVNASEYTDNTPIDAGDLTQIRVECYKGDNLTFTSTVPSDGVGAPQTHVFTGTIPTPGTYTCYAYSIVYDGTESDASNEDEKT